MEERVIELVKKKPILWNMNYKNYKKTNLKYQAWEEIGKELGMNGETVKKKFKSLRDYYRIQRKSQKRKSDDVPAWKFFHLFKFLDEEPRSTCTVIEDEGDSFVLNTKMEVTQEDNMSDTEDSTMSATSGKRSRKSKTTDHEETIARDQGQFSDLITTSKETLEPIKREVRAFFENIIVQVENANLQSDIWLELQEKIFHETLGAIRSNKIINNYSKICPHHSAFRKTQYRRK